MISLASEGDPVVKNQILKHLLYVIMNIALLGLSAQCRSKVSTDPTEGEQPNTNNNPADEGKTEENSPSPEPEATPETQIEQITDSTISNGSISTSNPGNTLAPEVSFTLHHNALVAIYSDNTCVTKISEPVAKNAGQNTMTLSSVSANQSTSIYLKAIYNDSTSSNCTLIGTYHHDNINPSLSTTSITTTNPSSIQTPTIAFSLSESASVRLYSDSRCSTSISSLVTKSSGANSITTDTLTANSTTSIYLKAVDAAGNSTDCSLIGSYTHNQNLPPNIINVSISTSNPGNSQTPTIAFTLTKDATVTLYSDNTCSTSISSASAKTQGANTLTTNSLTANSSTSIYAKAVDNLSNSSSCTSIGSYTHDNQNPTLSSLSFSSSNPGSSLTPTVAFTLSENATVTLYGDSGCTSAVSPATAKTSGANTLVTSTLTANAVTTVYAKAVDAAANSSTCTSVGSYTNDNTNPSLSALSITTTSPGTSATPTIAFTLSENANVTLYSNSGCSTSLSSATAKTSGANTMVTNSLTADSVTSVYVKASDVAGNSSSCSLAGSYTYDANSPSAGSAVEFSNVNTTTLSLSWGQGSDAATSNANLMYKVVYASNSNSIDDGSEIDSASGGSVLMNWTAGSSLTWTSNKATVNVTGLVMFTPYHFSVGVKDSVGNITVYSPQARTTACGCSDGQYASSGSCITAQTGNYAASCQVTACSNKPANSVYISNGPSTNACEWACDNGYLANSSYTACTSNAGYVPLSCGSNQLITGFSGNAASWIDKLGARCRKFTNGALTGTTIAGSQYGGDGGTVFTSDCPDGSAVSEVQYSNHVGNTNNVAGRFRYRCKNLTNGTVSAWIPTDDLNDSVSPYNADLYYGGSGSVADGAANCATPYYLNWLTIGSSGAYAGPFTGSVGCRSVASATNIVSQWQFDNSVVNSVTGSVESAQLNGGATYSTSIKKYGTHAIEFDGVDDYFDSGSSLLNNLQAFSVAGWVYVDERPGTNKVSFWGQNDLMEMGFNSADNSRDVCVWVNGSSEQCSSTELNLDTWYHIVVTMSSGGGTKLYLNGAQAASTAISTVGSTSGFSFKIGGGVWDATGGPLDGLVDDVMIYSRELSATEVAQLYGN